MLEGKKNSPSKNNVLYQGVLGAAWCRDENFVSRPSEPWSAARTKFLGNKSHIGITIIQSYSLQVEWLREQDSQSLSLWMNLIHILSLHNPSLVSSKHQSCVGETRPSEKELKSVMSEAKKQPNVTVISEGMLCGQIVFLQKHTPCL